MPVWGEDDLTEIVGLKTRQKNYNKMVQMLETKSVRSNVGSHWKDWVCQKDTRLADARNKAEEIRLTRAEVPFYIQEEIPDAQYNFLSLQSLLQDELVVLL